MRRQILLMLLFIAATIPQSQFVSADDDWDYAADAVHAANDIKWSTMWVRIVDPQDQPVMGAIVRPWALRAGNGHGAWRPEMIGAPVATTTDATGRAQVIYPVLLEREAGNPQPVTQVSMFLSNEEFCSENVHVTVNPDNPDFAAPLKLKRGVKLKVAGVAPGSKSPLSDCYVLLEGQSSKNEFVRGADGWLQSIPLSADRRWFRVVRAVPGELPQFSRLQAWSPDDVSTREVKVEVRPGVRVVGKISDDVPRPITRGTVVAWCGSPARSEQGGDASPPRPSWWIETVPIAEDGSFEFPSLPSGYLAQFYAMANDWISAQPTDEAYGTCCKWFGSGNNPRHEVFRYGQVLRLAKGESEFTLNMELAGQIRVKCIDTEGRPLSRIAVGFSPNQFIVGGGSTLFCIQQSSLNRLRNPDLDFTRHSVYSAETDNNGEALIRNLPCRIQSFDCGSAIWRVRGKQEPIEVKPDETSEVTITFERVR